MSTDCELNSNGKVFKKYLGTNSEFTIPDGGKISAIVRRELTDELQKE